MGASIIGLIAGFVVVYGIEFVDQKLKIDDPVGAIGVHGLCGALGTLLTGLFAVESGLFYGFGFDFFLVQLIGVLAVIAWVAFSMFIVFKIIDKLLV
jgi:Amt family ammonium transporter